jgi:HNH endonuclease
MHIDHIVPRGGDHPDNLALACASCNLTKGDATQALDPLTGARVPLFNPRTQSWSEHFIWIDRGCRIQGLNPTGRATVERFAMNQERMVIARMLWIQARLHPPRFS